MVRATSRFSHAMCMSSALSLEGRDGVCSPPPLSSWAGVAAEATVGGS